MCVSSKHYKISSPVCPSGLWMYVWLSVRRPSVHPSIRTPIHPSGCVCICPSVCVCLFVWMYVCLSVWMYVLVCQFIRLDVCVHLEVCVCVVKCSSKCTAKMFCRTSYWMAPALPPPDIEIKSYNGQNNVLNKQLSRAKLSVCKMFV